MCRVAPGGVWGGAPVSAKLSFCSVWATFVAQTEQKLLRGATFTDKRRSVILGQISDCCSGVPMSAALVSAIAAYLPRDRVEQVLRPDRPLPRDGVALIADISGFTPLTEALAVRLSPDKGAEELTRALVSVFTPLIAEVHAFRGTVLKFLGDAVIVWYPRVRGESLPMTIRRALTSALRMQQAMAQHGRVSTPIGSVTLTMKIGLAYGNAHRFLVGSREHGIQDVLCGRTLDRMSQAEHVAHSGEIVLDVITYAAVADLVTVVKRHGDFVVLKRLLRPRRPRPWPSLVFNSMDTAALVDILAAYIPKQVFQSLASGRAEVAELKPVVCLFAQFEGIDYDADPTAGEKLQTYVVAAQQTVARYGGFLIRVSAGDKGNMLHIVFGAPQAVEDQAERAVRCALDLRRDCGGLPFISAQRIGITSGRAFAGPLGAPERRDYTTMGDAINLAARLMQRAAAGQILLDDALRAQLGATIVLEELGHVGVKGKSQPITIYAAVRPLSARRANQAAPLFGRAAQLAALRQRLNLLEQGAGGVVLLTGEPGIGKTALVDTLRAEARTQWASGACQSYGQVLSGSLFADVLRDLLDLPDVGDTEEDLKRLVARCADLFGMVRAEVVAAYLARLIGLPLSAALARHLDGLAGESVRWQIFMLVKELLNLIVARGPLVLALDDLQWADPTSLELVTTILPLTASQPLLLLAIMRSDQEYLSQPGILRELNTVPTTVIALEQLDSAAAAELLAHEAPSLPEQLVSLVTEKSRGNPLFLNELARMLRARGMPAADADSQPVALEDLDVPDSLQALLLAEIDKLAVETRYVLQIASVIGPTFQRRVLAAIDDDLRLVEHLSVLEAGGYIRMAVGTEEEVVYRFAHGMIQESAYSTLLYAQRRAFHQAVAGSLEGLFPARIAEQVGLLAFHYERADVLGQAIYYLLQAADQDRLLHANAEAQARYRRSLTLLEQLAATSGHSLLEQRAQTYLKIAQVRANALDFASAQEYYNQAFTLLERPEFVQSEAVGTKGSMKRGIQLGVFEHGPATLDPGLSEFEDVSEIIRDLFEGLVELDADLNVIPALAERWQIDEGGRRYRFELRPHLHWSDGTPLTANDFVFAWRRNLHPATGAGLAGLLDVVQGAEAYHRGEQADPEHVGIRALDDRVLEIVLRAPIRHVPYLLTAPITYPQPAHAVRAYESSWSKPEHLICNGPFKIARWRQGDEILLERNPWYHGRAEGNLDRAVLRFVEPTLEYYERGNIDWCRIEHFDPTPRYPEETITLQYVQTCFLGFACQHPPFSDRLVRRAFAASLDQEGLVRQVLSNVQRPATGGLVPPSISGHSPEIGRCFDPAMARASLRQAGYASGADLPPIALATLPITGDIPRYLQESWQRHLGVRVNLIEDVPPNELIARLGEGTIQIAMLTWDADYPDPDSFLRVIFHSASPQNFFGWRNQRFDHLVDRAATVVDQHERLALYREADRILVAEDSAIAPLFYYQAFGLLRPRFRLVGSGRIVRGRMFKLKNIMAMP